MIWFFRFVILLFVDDGEVHTAGTFHYHMHQGSNVEVAKCHLQDCHVVKLTDIHCGSSLSVVLEVQIRNPFRITGQLDE